MSLRNVSLLCIALALPSIGACTKTTAAQGHFEAPGPKCDAGQQELLSFVHALPEQAVGSAGDAQLPVASLAGSFGSGSVLSVTASGAQLDAKPASGATHEERALALREGLAGLSVTKGQDERAVPLYVAASPEIDVRTLRLFLGEVPPGVELKLLFRTPGTKLESGEGESADLSLRLLQEPSSEQRSRLALQGYAAFSHCASLQRAVEGVLSGSDAGNWSRLRTTLLEAVPQCQCEEFDVPGLRQLILAQQRAGSMQLSSMPLSFMRDERCGASMPLRSVQKLLTQIEAFDEEFAGDWTEDAISFERVVTNERLLGFFCDALPGETLAALQRARRTLYLKVGGSCEGWRFAPLSPGAPMGTWRHLSSDTEPRALHYWQAAEQLRVFGPASADSKPTDKGPWPCERTIKLSGVEPDRLVLEKGAWFYSEAACQRAPADPGADQCFSAPLAPEAEPAEAEAVP